MDSNNVKKIYASVLEDVIEGAKEAYLDEGIDDSVRLELRDLWQSKLLALGAVHAKECTPAGVRLFEMNVPAKPCELTRIQIEIPAKSEKDGDASSPRNIEIDVPLSSMEELQNVMQQPEILAVLNDPVKAMDAKKMILAALKVADGGSSAASAADQSKVSRSTGSKPSGKAGRLTGSASSGKSKETKRAEMPTQRRKRARDSDHLDGGVGYISTSESESELGDLSDDKQESSGDDQDDDADDKSDSSTHETPLNSEDDDPDFVDYNNMEIENIIVCQYEKITRTRNKWTFELKDGIMNIKGKDYIFKKATGCAQW